MIIIAPCFHDFAHVAFGTCAGTHHCPRGQCSASLRYWGINSFTDGSAVTAARDSSCCSDIVRRSLCGRSVQLRCLFVCCDCHLMGIMGCMFLQYSTAALLRACSTYILNNIAITACCSRRDYLSLRSACSMIRQSPLTSFSSSHSVQCVCLFVFSLRHNPSTLQ